MFPRPSFVRDVFLFREQRAVGFDFLTFVRNSCLSYCCKSQHTSIAQQHLMQTYRSIGWVMWDDDDDDDDVEGGG